MNDTIIINNGKDACYHCARVIGGYTTLSACEALCGRYSSCDTVAAANDTLVEYEQGGAKWKNVRMYRR